MQDFQSCRGPAAQAGRAKHETKKYAREAAQIKKNCDSNFDSCRTLSPAAVQLRKLVVRSTKSPRRRFQMLKDEKCFFESRRKRKNATHFSRGQGSLTLVVLQRRNAGRAEHEIPPAAVPNAQGREAKLREPPAQRITSGRLPKPSRRSMGKTCNLKKTSGALAEKLMENL